jgi:uncharacterized protein
MSQDIVGRKVELAVLQAALTSNEAEMVAVLGRRRIGKTFLVTSAYRDSISFELSGTQNATTETQLKNFRDELSHFYGGTLPLEIPQDWNSAFQMLRQYWSTLDPKEKKVIFFDELPWLAGQKSGFLEALGYFWNSWASRQNLVVVICGSAASWMISKVVHNQGGLHNRITKRLHLMPFTLQETEAYLSNRHITFDRYQIVQLYMALGGVPHYLKEVTASKSATQNIERICFSREGQLRDEFSKLYHALFNNAQQHIAVIRALATKWTGLQRNEILEITKQGTGSHFSTLLDELEQSGFISSYQAFGKKTQGKTYRLTDPYSLFYLHFIEQSSQDTDTWMQLSQTQRFKSWAAYAFENIALQHVPQIKRGLGIGGVYVTASSFHAKKMDNLPGAQIDLLLDRNDRVINLIEIKFYDQPFIPDKAFHEQLMRRKLVFNTVSGTRKHLSWVLLSPYGIIHNQYSLGYVDNSLTLDELFG